MFQDSIIICYSTPNYSELKNIFFDSLHKVGVREEQIVHKLDNVGDSLLHLWTFKTPTSTLKKYKNIKSILMVLLFLLLIRSERRNLVLKFCWSCLFFYPTFR
jgi:hypothetical protein